jgi:hypothetical protein
VSKKQAATTGPGRKKQLMRTNSILGLTEGLETVAPTGSGFSWAKLSDHFFCKKSQNNPLTSSNKWCFMGAQQPKLLI